MEENNSQAPAALASSAAEVPKKTNSKNIVIALLCVLVLGLGCTVFYLALNKDKGKTPNTDNNQQEDIEVEVTSAAVKNDLFDKFSRLNLGIKKDDDDFYVGNGLSGATGLFANEMTEITKNYTALYDAKYTSLSKLGSDAAKELYDNSRVKGDISFDQFYADNYYLDGKEIAEVYKSLYGKEIVHKDNSSFCYLSYNKKYNVYFIDSVGCGGVAGDAAMGFYIDGYKAKGNLAYIDVYVEYATVTEAKPNYLTIYNDVLDYNTVIKECDDLNTLCQKITADNKEQFTHYRFVFEGENEDYHFVEVQRV